MDNPLLLPRPDDPVQCIHDYARDLAYLVVNGECSASMSTNLNGWLDNPHMEMPGGMSDTPNRIHFREKWGTISTHSYPSLDILAGFGYLEHTTSAFQAGDGVQTWYGEGSYLVHSYLITSRAFQLLEKPSSSPKVFISYRRKESSAFAIAIEARLRAVGIDSIFIDKQISAGDEWHGRFEQTISQCQEFICLIGPQTLSSPMVEKEIGWAVEVGCRLISIWHNGAKMDDQCLEAPTRRQSIIVTGESAREYENAINELLNSLGYRTY